MKIIKMKREEDRGLLKRDLECVEIFFSLLHVLLLLGGSKMALGFLLLQVEGALSLFSEWNGA